MRVLAKQKLTHRLPFPNSKEDEVELWIATYSNGRIALQLMAQMEDAPEGVMEPYMRPSVNLPYEECAENEVYIKPWDENEGIALSLIRWGVLEPMPVGRGVSYAAPRYRFSAQFMVEMAAALTAGKRVRR